ncbi:hypothetical protein CEXT_364211 [Caerostris extrusa]|uniref:Uncharacterized protein n=1 Tax=Caerostris extrusa TaxID=172846 RepID=A0AAV4X801_CAEEX|nr:hypothetical protein CEXT_364211 [Caerostris extrusa]
MHLWCTVVFHCVQPQKDPRYPNREFGKFYTVVWADEIFYPYVGGGTYNRRISLPPLCLKRRSEGVRGGRKGWTRESRGIMLVTAQDREHLNDRVVISIHSDPPPLRSDDYPRLVCYIYPPFPDYLKNMWQHQKVSPLRVHLDSAPLMAPDPSERDL